MRRRARVVSLILAALGAVAGLALVGLAPQPSGTSTADSAGAEPPPVPGSESSTGDAGVTATIRTTVAARSTSTSPPSTAATNGTTGTSTTPPIRSTGPSLPVSNVFVAQGEGFSATAGPARVTKGAADNGATLGFIENGDWVSYTGVDVPGARTFTARVASNTSGGMIEIRDGDPFGPLLGVVSVPPTGGWESFTTVSSPISSGPSGTLVLRFTGDSGYLLDVDTFMISTE